jgi:hypothetical protein
MPSNDAPNAWQSHSHFFVVGVTNVQNRGGNSLVQRTAVLLFYICLVMCLYLVEQDQHQCNSRAEQRGPEDNNTSTVAAAER